MRDEIDFLMKELLVMGPNKRDGLCIYDHGGCFMRSYLNPGNSEFSEILNGDYIDKTGLISLVNCRINTPGKLVCISRPRRFGKSYAANMLCAYYDHTCDSHSLFEKFEISKDSRYEENINKYNVIYLDIASFLSDLKQQHHSIKNVVNDISEAIKSELTVPFLNLENLLNIQVS